MLLYRRIPGLNEINQYRRLISQIHLLVKVYIVNTAYPVLLGPLLPAWINFNPTMDK